MGAQLDVAYHLGRDVHVDSLPEPRPDPFVGAEHCSPAKNGESSRPLRGRETGLSLESSHAVPPAPPPLPPGPGPGRRRRPRRSPGFGLAGGVGTSGPSPGESRHRPSGPAVSRPPTAFRLRVLPLVRGPTLLRALGLPRPPPAPRSRPPATTRSSGPTTCGARAVLEQHARWIAEPGVGAIALSWWGRGSFMDLGTPLILDVMRDHDLKVTFALEPYADDRGRRYRRRHPLPASRVRGEAGLRRLPAAPQRGRAAKGRSSRASGASCRRAGSTATACTSRPRTTRRMPSGGSRRIGSARHCAPYFGHVTLLADSLEFARTPAAGFDGIGIYDNYVRPDEYAGYAEGASRAGLLFSFNVNPGYDQIEPREIAAGSCYAGPRLRGPSGHRADRLGAQPPNGSVPARAPPRGSRLPWRPRSGCRPTPGSPTTAAASSSSTSTASTSGTKATRSSRCWTPPISAPSCGPRATATRPGRLSAGGAGEPAPPPAQPGQVAARLARATGLGRAGSRPSVGSRRSGSRLPTVRRDAVARGRPGLPDRPQSSATEPGSGTAV